MHVFEALGQKQGPGACQDVPVGSEQASGSVHHLSGRIVGVISHWVYTEVLRPVLGKDRTWRCLWNLVVAIGKDVLITCHRATPSAKLLLSGESLKACLLPPMLGIIIKFIIFLLLV